MTRTAAAGHQEETDPGSAGPVLDVVVPVHNEQTDLEPCVRRLHAYLRDQFPYSFRITVADNASVDATPAIAARLVGEIPEVSAVRLGQRGRGRALRTVWSASDATVLAYMDVDLSTDLAALLPLVAPLLSGHSDLAIGSRLARGTGGARREARVHLPLLQPGPARHAGGPVLRRAVRLQGDPRRRGRPPAAAGASVWWLLPAGTALGFAFLTTDGS